MRGLSIPDTPAATPVSGSPTSAPPADAATRGDPQPPVRLGDTEIARVRRTLAQHRRQRYPHGRRCGWCREPYPCTPRRAAERLLHAAGVPAVARVPGLSGRQRRDRGTVAAAQFLLMKTGR